LRITAVILNSSLDI